MDKYLARQIQESGANARHKAEEADVVLLYMLLGHVLGLDEGSLEPQLPSRERS